MLWTALLSVASHHGEAADPDLLEWIKGTLDHLLGVGPWVVIILLGLVILFIPLSVVVFYLVQQWRAGLGSRQSNN